MGYSLTTKAEEDVLRIFMEGVQLFGIEQAELYHRELARVFELISANPHIARERFEIAPPIRIHPHRSHLIVFLVDDTEDVLIVRVRHGHEDWEADPF